MGRGKEYYPCEAEIHAEGCNGIGLTEDHFTPKCIAKILGWKKSQVDSRENTQYLSDACHKEKDRTTPARLVLAIRQMRGEFISLEEYQRVINDPDYHPYVPPLRERDTLKTGERKKRHTSRGRKGYRNNQNNLVH